MDFEVELCFSRQQFKPQTPSHEHFSTFPTDTEQRFQNDFATDELDYSSDDCDDKASNHAWSVSLGRAR
jgi:hypothetical protein